MTGKTILLVRHGETEWNRARRYQGWSDSPLTEHGLAQAEAMRLPVPQDRVFRLAGGRIEEIPVD